MVGFRKWRVQATERQLAAAFDPPSPGDTNERR